MTKEYSKVGELVFSTNLEAGKRYIFMGPIGDSPTPPEKVYHANTWKITNNGDDGLFGTRGAGVKEVELSRSGQWIEVV